MFRLRSIALILTLAAAGCHATSAPPPPTATRQSAPAGARQTWLDLFARGYFPGRSGQVFLVAREGDFVVDRNPLYAFMHGSPWKYDTHIPLLFHGPSFIKPGTSDETVAQQDVVPTIAELIGTAPPATSIGRPLRQALLPSKARPRVVVLFVMDGTRADYFDTYADAMPTLSRLRREGAWFGNAHVTSVPTLTAVGHANLGTGSEPRLHGLVVNNLFNRVTGKPQEAYNGLDPGELMALTLADVWNIETEGRAIIIGQGGAIRATAGLIGHGACVLNGRRVLAASYSTRDAAWETNPTCYAMSEALKPLNARKYWEEAGGKWMGHDIADATKFRHSGLFQRFEGDALAGEQMGHSSRTLQHGDKIQVGQVMLTFRNPTETTENKTARLSPEALEEVRRRAAAGAPAAPRAAAAVPVVAAAAAPVVAAGGGTALDVEPDGGEEKKKKKKKKEDDRIRAAYINSVGRTIAQVIGAIVTGVVSLGGAYSSCARITLRPCPA